MNRFGHLEQAPLEQAERARSDLGIPSDAFLFVCVQPLTPEFAPWVALDSFSQATGGREHAYMLVVGSGREHGEFIHAATRCGLSGRLKVVADEQASTPAALAAADTFVQDIPARPGHDRLFEAMYAGLPVIAILDSTQQAGMSHDREALLSPPGDRAAMARNMVQLMRNPDLRQQLGRNARDAAIKLLNQRAA